MNNDFPLLFFAKKTNYIMKGDEYFMKKIDIKGWTGVAMAVVTGIVAFTSSIADKEKTQKIEELIKKVDELTENK